MQTILRILFGRWVRRCQVILARFLWPWFLNRVMAVYLRTASVRGVGRFWFGECPLERTSRSPMWTIFDAQWPRTQFASCPGLAGNLDCFEYVGKPNAGLRAAHLMVRMICRAFAFAELFIPVGNAAPGDGRKLLEQDRLVHFHCEDVAGHAFG